MSLEDLIGGWAATLKKICSSIGIIIAVYRSSISWNWNLLETIHQLFLENRSFYFSNQKTISLTEKRWLYCPNLSCGHHLFSVLREVLRGLAGSQWREILWNLGFSEECPKKKPQWWRPKVINYNVCLLHRGKPLDIWTLPKPWAIFANIRVGLLGSKTSMWSGASWLLHVA